MVTTVVSHANCACYSSSTLGSVASAKPATSNGPTQTHQMKLNISLVIFVFIVGIAQAPAGQIDPRFEGMWVGSETYAIYKTATQNASPSQHMDTAIVIDPAGGMFGVLAGLGPGKYKISPSQSHGRKLFFASHLTGTGRNNTTFELSEDGNTIIEHGFGVFPCIPYACECSITATLHRKGKK